MKEMMKVKRLMYSIVLAAIFLTAVVIACIDLPPSGVIIYAFDQNPAGLDEGNEWVAIHNPTNKSVDIGNWTLETTNGSTVSIWIAEGTTLYPGAYYTFSPCRQDRLGFFQHKQTAPISSSTPSID